MKNVKTLSPFLLLLAAMLWGFAFAAQGAASSLGAFTLGVARNVIATLFLIPIIILFDRLSGGERRLISRRGIDINRTELVGGIICGAILTVASALQQFGINDGTDTGKAGFITALYVVFVPIYALVLKKKAPFNVWIAVAIATVGFYFLCISDTLTVVPSDMLVLGAALLFPIHILAIDRFSPLCDGVRMSMIQFASAAILNLAFVFIFEPRAEIGQVFDSILPVLYLGIASSGVAYTLQIIGQRGVNPAAASVILSLESVFAVLGAAIFMGTTLSPREYIGCAIVFAAVILAQLDIPAILKSIRSKK
jgi:drug/metabolite transporter (DMT)-like permease